MIPFYEHLVTVQSEDIDEMDHANNVCYVRWMQDAAIGHSTVSGWSSARYLENGFAWVARRHTVEYLQPALLGDELTVHTGIVDFQNVRSTRRYHFIRKSDGALIAKAETLWAFISIYTRRPVRIPVEVSSCFIVTDIS
ncbi:hypothetical protein AGMMS50229_18140 [Campylobacterota bacterium]|nr:hypothetical protein AGMMS50229_18140 [Campylobacterota bacterium]